MVDLGGGEIRLTILGEPVQWKAPKVVFRKAAGHPIGISADVCTRHKSLIRQAWFDAGQPTMPKDTPLTIRMAFYLTKPKSAPKKRLLPAYTPDWVNLAKLCEDALGGLAFENDSRFVDAHVIKRYASYPDSPARTEVVMALFDS
jgi:Holliday junction resolvase RusA-like endonuclease